MVKAPGRRAFTCCFRPSPGDNDESVSKGAGHSLFQELQDSANEDRWLSLRSPKTAEKGEADDQQSPASSYLTCFSDVDQHRDLRRSESCEWPALVGELDGELTASDIDESSPPPHLQAQPAVLASLPAGLQEDASCVADEETPEIPPCNSAPTWLDTHLGIPPAKRRNRLPDPKQQLPALNIFSLAKDWIGKDIHKLALPTHINEPLTELQKRAEVFHSSELLDEAALLPPQSVERLLHVTAFVVSTYNNMKRTDKPFKNLQNATYELVYPEKGVRMIMEKVEHIPIVSAVHIEGRAWTYSGNDWLYMSLRFNYAAFRPIGSFFLRFNDGDEYMWNCAMAYGHNIFWGTRYLDHGGPFNVTCLSTGATMQGSIDHSLFHKSTKQVTCTYEKEGYKVEGVGLWGAWDDAVWAAYPDGSRKQLWKAAPPPQTDSKFLFPLWALHINELTPELLAKLPPTDDRLRTDMRLFEHGYYIEADLEKVRLEAKQRQERTAAEAAGKPWQPRWFEKVEGGCRGHDLYRYKGGYWEARESGNWKGCRDIYGPGPVGPDGAREPAKLLL